MFSTLYGTKREITEVGRRLYELGLISGADGNVSVRIGNDRLLVTPAGVQKAEISANDVVMVDLAGRVYGRGRPSSELRMHLEVYRKRSDVKAAIHAHPPWAVAASLHNDFLFDFVPEAVVALGGVYRAPYARPGTPAVAASISNRIHDCNTFVLTRHGSLTVGNSLTQALIRLENLEHNAKIGLLARSAGPLTGLPPEEIAALRAGASYTGAAKRAGPRQPPVRGRSRIRISDEEGLVP